MASDNAYNAIVEVNDVRWAFGTGFREPLSVDGDPLPGVDRAQLAAYCLLLGDDALILSHRLQEWCTRAPELEDEVAIANIALDLLGHARLLYARAGVAEGDGRGEDDYAYLRDVAEFGNVTMAELDRGDFAHEIVRLLLLSTWRLAQFDRLVASADPVLSAVAAKGLREVTYHRDYAAGWAVRLGDGTTESHHRLRAGLETCWPYVDELFTAHPIELAMEGAGVGVDPAELRAEFDDVIGQVLASATLPMPLTERSGGAPSGRAGTHTDAMPRLLAELQSVAREHRGATW